MKKTLNTLAAVVALAIIAAPLTAQAHCGACGSGDKHEKKAEAMKAEAKKASATELKAIFPLAEEAGFTTLIAAVKAAGLEETLTKKGPFTVFAPTDEAFAKLPEGTVEGLLENPEKLKKVLLYHVVSGTVTSSQVVKLDKAKTVEGGTVTINAKDGVMINDAQVIKADIEAKNGIVHVIDSVLIPADL
jgi:uncharacterized surface protein with fasciclin (FAS1) repeats